MSGAEVFGIVTGALGCLQQAYEFIGAMRAAFNHLKEAGLEIEQIHRRLQTTMMRLDSWPRLWYIADSTPSWIFDGFWGEDKCSNVLRQLYEIKTRSKNVFTKLNKLQDPVKRQELMARAEKIARDANITSRQEKDAHLFAVFDGLSRKAISKSKRINYLFAGPDDILAEVKVLDEKFAMLYSSTNEFFEARHRQAPGYLQGPQRVGPAIQSNLLPLATAAIGASAVVYNACATLCSTIPLNTAAVPTSNYLQRALSFISQVPRP